MRLFTSPGLAYPITITKLLVRQAGDAVEENGALFAYSYVAIEGVRNEDTGFDVPTKINRLAEFGSEVEGTLASLHIKVGQVIHVKTLVAVIEEPCKHEVQFGGMCADCGKDMNTVSYSTTVKNTERATINSVHGHTALLVSQAEAGRVDEEAKRRLLDSRKLSLVVDLDQTIIHATVDPTVGEWQADESNPNYDAVKDVRKFQLVDEGLAGRRTWYYIKLRPGLQEFLQTIAQYYELHIYTMATRAYAKEIANIVDPDHKLFADRILSRDENGSMNSKSLQRLFPVDTKMVVIIDDRGDVWSWSPNLVKVFAYDFFVGIGDINSAFLPKLVPLESSKPKLLKPVAKEEEGTKEEGQEAADAPNEPSSEVKSDTEESTAPSTMLPAASTPPTPANGDLSAVDRMVSMAGKQDSDSMESKTEEQDKTIAAQLADRPLLQRQKILDAATNDEAKASPAAEAAVDMLSRSTDAQDGDGALESSKFRHNLLQDDDAELESLAKSLRKIHETYFTEYDSTNSPSSSLDGSRVAELRPNNKNINGKKRSLDLDTIPDAATLIARLKRRVLAGCHIVFSGVVPLGTDIHTHDLGLWAKSFGATIGEDVERRRTTHVVASAERRTAKVRQAVKVNSNGSGRKGRGKIEIVGREWLFACFREWEKVGEAPYRVHADASCGPGKKDLPGGVFGAEGLVSEEEDGGATTEGDGEESATDDGGFDGDNGGAGGLEIDTDLELEMYAPTIQRKDSSPTGEEQSENWESIMDELDDFLGSEGDESESENGSVRDGTATPVGLEVRLKSPPSQRKRKRQEGISEVETDSDGGEGEGEGSRLQKRKKEALGRTSSLTNMAVAAAAGPPTDGVVGDPGGGIVDDDDDDDDLDLEAALAAEMERQSEEDELQA